MKICIIGLHHTGNVVKGLTEIGKAREFDVISFHTHKTIKIRAESGQSEGTGAEPFRIMADIVFVFPESGCACTCGPDLRWRHVGDICSYFCTGSSMQETRFIGITSSDCVVPQPERLDEMYVSVVGVDMCLKTMVDIIDKYRAEMTSQRPDTDAVNHRAKTAFLAAPQKNAL